MTSEHDRAQWRADNQRHLVAEIANVRTCLDRHARDEPPRPSDRDVPGRADSALDFVCQTFGLSPFERQLLVLCAGVELEADLARYVAAATGTEGSPGHPTFALALAALPGSHWDAITPNRPLRRYQLVELGGEGGAVYGRLRIPERVLHFLTGLQTPEPKLAGVLKLIDPAKESDLAPSHRTIAQQVGEMWAGEQPAVPQLCSPDATIAESVASVACARHSLCLYAIRACDVPFHASEREALARLWERESRLAPGALVVVCEDHDHADHRRAATAFVETLSGCVAIAGVDPLQLRRHNGVRFDLVRPPSTERVQQWRAALGPVAEQLNGQIGGIVAQFDLTAAGMRAAASQVDRTDGEDVGARLWDACREQARPRMHQLAQRIDAAASWDDIVLPPDQMSLLQDLAAHVRHRAKVYEQWGFSRHGSRGLGITALFAGASGTGKTMAAEVLANELRLDLYRVDLSQVVSKYIGETEKNLRRIFDAAEAGGAVLLFDEADSLFGKRSEVKDSHDRYANLEVSYLLQRMEAYRGLAVLTTNIRNALDTAFLRRLRFIVEFPFPGVAERTEIWRRVFPKQTPTEGLDHERLGRLNITGGVIRNIALNGAFVAADDDEPVRMRHLRRAARAELVKLERPVSEAELGGWT